jgi:nucleoid DNA-binding protein
MVYSTLVSRLAEATGISEDNVRKILTTLPEVLMQDPEGEQTRTPLGVFTIIRRKQKAVRTPDGKWSSAPERIQAKLKSGKKMQKEIDQINESSQETSVSPAE